MATRQESMALKDRAEGARLRVEAKNRERSRKVIAAEKQAAALLFEKYFGVLPERVWIKPECFDPDFRGHYVGDNCYARRYIHLEYEGIIYRAYPSPYIGVGIRGFDLEGICPYCGHEMHTGFAEYITSVRELGYCLHEGFPDHKCIRGWLHRLLYRIGILFGFPSAEAGAQFPETSLVEWEEDIAYEREQSKRKEKWPSHHRSPTAELNMFLQGQHEGQLG